jgi:outer membrane protein OmpA-like peptidoglycan-associated protein
VYRSEVAPSFLTQKLFFMLKARIILVIIGIAMSVLPAESQKILKRVKESAKRAAEQKAEQKTSEEVEKGIDKSVEGVKSIFKKKNKDSTATEQEAEIESGGLGDGTDIANDAEAPDASAEPGFGVYSNFTFEPGNKILYYEDFMNDALGDFPVSWETSGSGEVVTNTVAEGKWLSIDGRAGYMPTVSELPENYTIEFDILTNGMANNQQASSLTIALTKKKTYNTGSAGGYGQVFFSLHKSASISVRNKPLDGNPPISSKLTTKFPLDAKVHVSIAVNKSRMRVWLDEKKIVDIPSLLAGNLGRYLLLQTYGIDPEKGHVLLISNFRIAEAGKDIRSTLMDSGSFSTTGIYFKTNEAVIQPESYAILKTIADYLKQEPTIKIQVIGHTDDQGEDAYNQELSEKRAAAVVNCLVQQFAIEADRLSALGKGETNPVDDNQTDKGRANNRRVEFVKQ